jgi:hypothetical protein
MTFITANLTEIRSAFLEIRHMSSLLLLLLLLLLLWAFTLCSYALCANII